MTHLSETDSAFPATAFYELSPDLLYITDLQGIIQHASPAAESLLGYKPAQLVGLGIEDLAHPDDIPIAQRAMKTLSETGVVRQVEIRGYDAAGQTRWFEVSAKLGNDGYIYAIARDVTDRSLAVSTLNEMNEAVFAVDRDWRFTLVNPLAEAILQRRENELIGQSVWEMFPEAIGTEFERKYRHAVKTGESASFRAYFPPLAVWVQVNAHPSDNGLTVYFYDISDQVYANERLRILERSVEASANGIVIADATRADFPIVYVNPAFERITGYSSDEAVGRNCRFLQHARTDLETRRRIRDALQTRTEVREVLVNQRKNGELFWNELYIAPVADENGSTTHFIGIQNDLSARSVSDDDVVSAGLTDPLTGLPGRSLFMTRLQQALVLSRHPDEHLAILTIQLEQLNRFSLDRGGEFVNELVLKTVDRIHEFMHQADTLGRMSADTLALALHTRSAMSVDALADRLVRVIGEPLMVAGEGVRLGASIGLSRGSAKLEDATQMIRESELAANQAQLMGGQKSLVYQEGMESPTRSREKWRQSLERALTEQQLYLVYQPLVDAATGRVSGVEVLTRWQHPDVGLIPPDQFIGMAEATGLIEPMTEWLIQQLFKQMESRRSLTYGINLSPSLITRPKFVQRLVSAAVAANVPPGRVELELTENVLIDTGGALPKALADLKRAGFRLAVDDFGSGFSGLSYLRELPIDTVKIDRSFIRDIVSSVKDGAIVESVVTMARQLNFTVVAEGVETMAQARHLARLGVNALQGFLFARPMPWSELKSYLADGTPKPGYVALPYRTTDDATDLLLVDGDSATLNALSRLFRRERLPYSAVTTYARALNELAAKEVKVLICDLHGKKTDCLGFLATVCERFPQIPVIVMSGSVSVSTVTEAINTGAVYRYITKPWSDSELVNLVKQASHEAAKRRQG